MKSNEPQKYFLIQEESINEFREFRNEFNEFAKTFKQKESEELLTREQTCFMLKISLPTLWQWSKNKKLNAYYLGNRVYYKRSEIYESLENLNKKQ